MTSAQRKTRKANWAWIAALAAALGWTTCAYANPTPLNRDTVVQQPQHNKQKPRTYTGTVQLTQSGRYALITTQTRGGSQEGFYFDNSALAKKYYEQEVRVTALINRRTHTMRVISIRPVRK